MTARERMRCAAPAALSLVAVGLFGLGMRSAACFLFARPSANAVVFLLMAILLSSMVDAASDLRYPLAAKAAPGKLIAPALAVLVGASTFGFAAYLRGAPRGGAEPLAVDWPVRGEWKVVTGGRSGLTNYHNDGSPTLRYAVDLVRVESPTEGEPVYAPADGTVAVAIDDRAQGSTQPEGNLVVIRLPRGEEIWLAHLQRGSVAVKEGQPVSRGTPIARCGASGSATAPHLHIHTQLNGEPVPMLFGEEKRFLVRNDRVP